MSSTLTDTVAIVTGAGSGIGEATAKALAHVRVGLLEPGAVDTEAHLAHNDEVLDGVNAARTIAEPLQPQDIAEHISFMVTDSSIADLSVMPTSQA